MDEKKKAQVIGMDGKALEEETGPLGVEDFLQECCEVAGNYDRAIVIMSDSRGLFADQIAWVGMDPLQFIGILEVVKARVASPKEPDVEKH